MSAMNRSLVELEPYCRERGIRLALEILPEKGGYEQVLFPALKAFSREFLGFCYDVGHHNITKDSDDLVRKNECRDQISDRLFAVHVHDNDGAEDRHWIPFTGTVDWQNVADFLRTANYSKPLNLEINFAKSGLEDEDLFLRQARQSIARLRSMVDGVANR
jgi:sugar phosphate isomerase/epimerase